MVFALESLLTASDAWRSSDLELILQRRHAELLMPRGFRTAADTAHDDVQQIRLAGVRLGSPPFQRRRDVARAGHALASHTLAFGQLHEIDVRIAEIQPVIPPGLRH